MKRVLVTGGAGFIGSHTVDSLLELGLDVVVYDNLSTGKLSYINLFHPNLRFIQQDILDYPTLTAEISRCDAVLHLAAISSVPKSIEDPIQSLRVNSQGFVHVLQAIREVKKPIRLVYASSAAIYGNAATLPCHDDALLNTTALSPYALEKLNNEYYADLYRHLFNIPSLGLRYFNVYGPRQDPTSSYSGVISKFVHHSQHHEPLTIFGDGTQSRDFIYIADIVRANVLALQNNYSGILNIATGIPETLLHLIHYLEKATHKTALIEFKDKRAGDIAESYASTLKAKEHIEFCYTVSLEEGIKNLVASKNQIRN